MKKRFWIPFITAFILSLSTVTTIKLCNASNKFSDIEMSILQSLMNEPDHWAVTGLSVYYCEDKSKLWTITFPDIDDDAQISIIYSIYGDRPYIKIEKPMEKRIDGRVEKLILIEVKKIIYNKLKKDLEKEGELNISKKKTKTNSEPVQEQKERLKKL